MSGSDPTLLAEMAAFWVEYDAATTDAERARLIRRWHLTHGGRVATVTDRGFLPGDIIPGLYPVREEEE